MKGLTFKKVHPEIEKKGDFYVSCSDFVDDRGNRYDIDFLVASKDGDYRVFQAVVHGINGQHREYNIEGSK